MSRILHLSDLHLGNTNKEDEVGDYKIEAIDEGQRTTRAGHIKTTLTALGRRLEARAEPLDAVVVTGDVTTRSRPDGFDRLPELLSQLGPVLPDRDRIVVVPGNHDVTWHKPAGSPERYANFVEKVRDLGYVTPLLDGIDYDSDGSPKAGRLPYVEGDDFVVVALNSSDMCGVLEPFSDEAEANLQALIGADAIKAKLAAQIRAVRTWDMPRLSPDQMNALSGVIEEVSSPTKVLIVALHHHLLPVTPEEEAKPFESFVNLGAVLRFLGATHTDVVLHGHKHVEGEILLPLSNDQQGVYEAVVASCGTIGGQQGVGHEVAKLVEVDSTLPTLRSVTVSSVTVPASAMQLPDSSLIPTEPVPVRRTHVSAPRTVTGTTVSAVHEQLLEIAASGVDRLDQPLVCTVRDGSTADTPPASYPWPDEVADQDAWFIDLVNWWQEARSAPGKPFTHGQRLRDYRGNVNQVGHAVDALRNVGSTRAIAVLIDPSEDFDARSEFPSFSLVQFQLRGQNLDCTAYFRKQEMRYWWPINVAELNRLQAEVLQELDNETCKAGSITTVANVAVFSDKVPKVNVPEIDRVAWRNENELRALALAIIDPAAPAREARLAELSGYLFNWVPKTEQAPTDGAPVPVVGLRVVAEFLASVRSAYPDRADQLNDLVDALTDLHDAARAYTVERADDSKPTSEPYERLRQKVARYVPRLEGLLGRLAEGSEQH